MGRDSIEIRTVERKQLLKYLPEIVYLYQSTGLGDKAADMVEAYNEIESSSDSYIDLGETLWWEVSQGLDELDEMQASWLATKISRRADLSVQKMSFSTMVPVGYRMTEKKPVRP